MAQFEIKKKMVVGEINLANYKEIETELKSSLESYKEFKVSNQTYAEAKTKRAELNKFDKLLNRVRIDTKKEFLVPFEKFEEQLKTLTKLVADTSVELDQQIKEIDDREVNAKKFDIETFYQALQVPVSLEKVYRKEWDNKSYSLDTIKAELLAFKETVNKELDYINRNISNVDPLLKARVKTRYLDTLDLIGSIDKENELSKKVNGMAIEYNNDNLTEVKEIEVVITCNAKQWYQLQNYALSIGAKINKKVKEETN